MKLRSDVEVTLREITFNERKKAKEAQYFKRSGDGLGVHGLFESQYLWVRAGLVDIKFPSENPPEIKKVTEDGREYLTDETLNNLSDGDFDEIASEVMTASLLGNYERKD